MMAAIIHFVVFCLLLQYFKNSLNTRLSLHSELNSRISFQKSGCKLKGRKWRLGRKTFFGIYIFLILVALIIFGISGEFWHFILDLQQKVQNYSHIFSINHNYYKICFFLLQYFKNSLNTRLSLVYVETWQENDQAPGFSRQRNIQQAMKDFSDYAGRKLYSVDKDTTQLLT